MKLISWALAMVFLALLGSEQAAAYTEKMWHALKFQGNWITNPTTSTAIAHRLYPGQYTIWIMVGKDQVGCSLRVGTKSSNTKLLKVSGPLAVRNATDPVKFFGKFHQNKYKPENWPHPFNCVTKGTITVSNPPTVVVPTMLTLTYGTRLKKTLPILVRQKIGIKSVSASPVRRTYSQGQPVTLAVNFTRNPLRGERWLRPKWRVTQGKLCHRIRSLQPTNEWTDFRYFAGELDSQPLTESVTLCESGKTIVEFSFVYDHGRFAKAQTDPRIKRLVFNVGKRAAPTRRRSQIRSRGIDNPPPLIVPDPEPPALPNFEMQEKKP